MADLVFNIAKGRVAYYATLPAASDALIVVPIQTTGIVSDTTMKRYATLAALLAGGSTEQTTMGRKTLTGVTSAPNNTTDIAAVGAANIVWAAATGNAISKLVVCYDADTGTGTDADLIPLTAHDCVMTPDGSDFTAVINAAGLYTAA